MFNTKKYHILTLFFEKIKHRRRTLFLRIHNKKAEKQL